MCNKMGASVCACACAHLCVCVYGSCEGVQGCGCVSEGQHAHHCVGVCASVDVAYVGVCVGVSTCIAKVLCLCV